jgi:hypothetical protein
VNGLDETAVRRRHPKSRADQIEEYIDLLTDIAHTNPDADKLDRIERALAELRREAGAANTRMVVYDVPVRAGAPFARITLPMDLTAVEAERMCAVIRSLAFPDQAEES